MKKTIYNICMVVFEITLPLFLLMGAVLVFGQLIGALMGNGAIVLGLNNAIKNLLRMGSKCMRILRFHHELCERKKRNK